MIEPSRIVMLSFKALIENNFSFIHGELTRVGHMLIYNSPKDPNQCLQIYKTAMNQYNSCKGKLADSEKAHIMLMTHFPDKVDVIKQAKRLVETSKDFCEDIKKRADKWKSKFPNAKNE